MYSTARSTQELQIATSNDLLIPQSSQENIDHFEEYCSSNSTFPEKYRFSNDSFHPLVGELLIASLLSLFGNSYHQFLDNKTTYTTLSHESFGKSSYSLSNTSSPISTTNSYSWILDFDKANYSVSLLNLDVEDSELVSDTDQVEFDHLQSSGFPSPSYKIISWPTRHSSSTVTSTEVREDIEDDFEDFDFNRPLFWPFERKFDWNSKETWRCFTMSPRKNIKTVFPSSTPDDHHDPHSFELSLHQRERPHFKLESAASNKIMERRQKNDNVTNSPSRFTRATKNNNSVKIVPLETENDIIVESRSGKKSPVVKKSDNLDWNYFSREDFGSKAELPIEMLLGLDEFDGREGVDSEFNQDDFSLHESLS
ncbi:hypothetical protein TorRG33x02_006390 [Trema orientale]|uniref:Uncharacterized protein n=1 Tax=Trema orientale TaxID=63057 RepID=A0A2P5G069_TREOI|nr:hypothetical protein TorRG33x02_006390 [Trema orientale]